MIVLKLIHRCLTILGLCVEPSCNEIYASIVNYIITSFVTGFLLITVEFIFTHFDDRANALYALMQFVTFVTVWTCYICFAKKKRATFQFIGEMQRIVNRSKNHQISNGIYLNAEKKSHAITKWPPIIFFAAFYGVIIISILDIIISDVVPGELHPENWYTFYKMTVPFSRHSILGLLGYFVIQFVLLHCYYAGLLPPFSFFVSSCYYLQACCSDLSEQFGIIDTGCHSGVFIESEVKTKLIKIVQFHIKVIELFKLLTQIFSGIIFYQLACGSAFISTTVFQLDLAWGTFDGNFFVIVCVVILSIMCIFPYCWYATVLSMNLHTIGDDAYKSLWYVYSVKVQICTQRIIAYAQIRRNFHGYNIFICSLEVFMKIVKASASYYLMLKSF